MDVTVNGLRRTISSLAELPVFLQQVNGTRYSEIWLNRDSGEALAILVNDDRAWLLYIRCEGDAGFSSRDPAYAGPKGAVLDLHLSNGQRDEYPESWQFPPSQRSERSSGSSFLAIGTHQLPGTMIRKSRPDELKYVT